MKIVDLTHPIHDGQAAFPGDPRACFSPHSTLAEHGFSVTRLILGSHHGSHLDAPAHCLPGGMSVDALPLDSLIGPAVLVDFAPGHALPPRTVLSAADFQPFESLFAPRARILYRTGWARCFGTPEFYTECPVLRPDAARWIAARDISVLGMDTPTPELDSLQCHHILLGHAPPVILLESLAIPDDLPAAFYLSAAPLKLAGLDGSPVRALAFIEGRQ